MSLDKSISHKGPLAWMTKNSVAANILMWVCLIGGLYGFYSIKKEVFPEYELDLVTITVPYPGSSPEDVEQGVILAIEEAISDVDGIQAINSTAGEGAGTVSIELDESANSQLVYQNIKQEVDRIRTFPVDAEEPKVSLSVQQRTVMSLVLYGQTDERSLRNSAEEVRDALLGSPGISRVLMNDARPMEIQIQIPEARLTAYGLTLQNVADTIRREVVEVSGGSLTTSSGEILLRVSERRDFASQFERLAIVSPRTGSPIPLGQIAEVKESFEDVDRYAFFNGKPSIELVVDRVGDQTPIGVSDATLNAIEKIKPGLPKGVELAVLSDRSEQYRQRLSLLTWNALQGVLLVMVMLTLFLNWKLAFWVTMGIPVSFLGAMVVLPYLGVSINMVSMFAFIIATGIVVDDAIVIGENIYEYRQRGMSLLDASIQGTRDVAMPVVFSLLTNVVAFMPLLMIPGFLGKIWSVIPVVVGTVFIVSLVETMFILPAHLAHSKETGKANRFSEWQNNFSNGFVEFIHRVYPPIIAKVVKARYLSLAIGIGMMILVISWPVSGRMGFELFPIVEADRSDARATLPLGSPKAEVERVAGILIEKSRKLVEENGGEKLSTGTYTSINQNQITVRTYLTAPDVRPIQTAEFTDMWRESVGTIPGVDSLRFAADSGGPGGGAGLTVELSHRDVDTLREAAEQLAARLADYSRLSEIDAGFQEGKQQFNFTLKEEARRLNLSSNEIGRQVRAAFFGAEALRQQRGRNEVKVVVALPESERQSQTHVRDLLIRTPDGVMVPLHALVELNPDRAYASITRKDGRRTVNVTANVTPRKDAQRVKQTIETDVLPGLLADYPGLTYSFEGRQAVLADSMKALGQGYLLILLVIYVLLAIPTGSYLQPLIVMLAIPFGILGAIVGHMVMGYSMSIISMMGIIAVSGVVVNDSLVMVDYANSRIKEGMSPLAAICSTGARRFRPIMLTTVTTFVGLAPMIFETSRQARFMIPMAISLGFGVLFATAISLLLVPCLFMVIEDIRALFGENSKPEKQEPSMTEGS